MNIKDCRQTVDGTPVMIYNTQAGGNYPIHGAFWEKINKYWIIQTWTAKGELYPDSHSGMNLDLTDWQDQIPWDCLVDEIEWIARDKNNKTFTGFKKLPEARDGVWYNGGYAYPLACIKMPKGPADWREAIAQRPKK